MTSFRKTTSAYCSAFVLAVTICVLFQSGLLSLRAEGALVWVWILPVVLVVTAAIASSVMLRKQVRRDLQGLRSVIHELATPEKAVGDRPFAVQELGECAAELAEVAERLREEQSRLTADATRDPLTGLCNRRPFTDTLIRETAFAQRTGWPVSLVMVDLDHFKRLNDEHGHKAGDQALQRTADRLGSLVRQSDSVARYGGEEFAIILPGTRLDQARRIAQQLCDAIRADEFVYADTPIHITASFGVAELHECGLEDAEHLIQVADAALYEAKRTGRDRVRVGSRDDGWSERQPVAEGEGDSGDAESPTPLDRDTLALMGSTFSVLRVMPDKSRVASDVAQQVAAVLEVRSANLYLWNDNGSRLMGSASAVGEQPPSPGADLEQYASRLHACCPIVSAYSLEPAVVQVCGGQSTEQVVRLALVADGRFVGVVEGGPLPEGFEFSPRQRTVLSALTAIGATALQNCDQFERLTNRMCGLIEMLCRAIHAHDPFRRDHCERVSRLTVDLGGVLGQHDEEELQLLRIAGLVHDIGNIGVPDRLLSKRGKLREGEWRAVREHCRIGADIIDGVAEMERLAEIVRHHHEHFDGGGYPDGLSGRAIPLESRLLAVADAYVAMTSPRPHRPPRSHQEAVEIIRGEAGSQFDPAIVEAFLSCAAAAERGTASRRAAAPGVTTENSAV